MPRMPKVKWTLLDLRNFFLLEIVLIIGLFYLTNSLIGTRGLLSDYPQEIVLWILYGLQTLTLLVPLYYFTVRKYNNKEKDFGLVKIPKLQILKRVGQGFLIYYIFSAMFLQVQMSYDVKIPGFGEQETHIPLVGDSMPELIFGGLVIVLIAPLVEELFFRGYLYQTLRKYAGVFWASAGSAFIFSIFHLEFAVFIPIFILGVVLNWTFEKSRSLWAPIAFHVINNAFAFALEIALYFEWVELGL